jgi:hypothetical protein
MYLNSELASRVGLRGLNYLHRYGYIQGEHGFSENEILRALRSFSSLLLPDLSDEDLGSDYFFAAFAVKIAEARCGVVDVDARGDALPSRAPSQVLQLLRSTLKSTDQATITLTYRIDGPPPPDVTMGSVQTTLKLAVDRWAEILVSGRQVIKFQKVDSGPSHIKFKWSNIDGSGGAIGKGNRLGLGENEGIVVFDIDDPWSESSSASAFHIRTIALHEIGHALGLSHIFDPDPKPIMYPTFGMLAHPKLESSDEEEFRKIYKQ